VLDPRDQHAVSNAGDDFVLLQLPSSEDRIPEEERPYRDKLEDKVDKRRVGTGLFLTNVWHGLALQIRCAGYGSAEILREIGELVSQLEFASMPH
jgi:hypothetical protein